MARTRAPLPPLRKIVMATVRNADSASDDNHIQGLLGEDFPAIVGNQAGASQAHRHPAVGVHHYAV